jgi:hypothetical protein
VAREELWAQPRGSFSETILLTQCKQFAVISRSDVLVIFGASQEGFAMSFAPFGHHSQLAGALHFARGRKLRVGSVNVHLSQPILDFKSFEVQGVCHVDTVVHPHAVRVSVLVAQVVDVVTTDLNDANVIGVQDRALFLFPVTQALLAINAGVKGRVCSAELIIVAEEGLDCAILVEGDSYTELPLATQVIRKTTLETVLHSLVVGESTATNKGQVVATYNTVMTDFHFYARPVPDKLLRSPK